MFEKFKKCQEFEFDKFTKKFKYLKCLNLKQLLKSMDLESPDFKSINLKSKFKFKSKFPNATLTLRNLNEFKYNKNCIVYIVLASSGSIYI